mgnify:CR=1 FL=1
MIDDEIEKHKTWREKINDIVLREPKDIDELIDIIRHAKQQGIIDLNALDMIEGVLSVTEKQVRDVMIPRPSMTVLPGNKTPSEVLKDVTQSKHSRFPIIDPATEKITGILLAKDLLKVITETNKLKMQIHKLARPAKIVPESKRLDVLLTEFREHRNHMAIVVDEYGRTAGLVTIEDVLEEIVGEIADEFDQKDTAPFIRQIDKTTFIVNALTPMDEFNEFFHTVFSHDDFDTIGGLLLKHFSHVPKKGATIEINTLRFAVLAANHRGIGKIKVTSNEAI